MSASVTLIVGREDLEEFERLAKQEGVKVDYLPARGIEPISSLVVIVTGTVAAIALVSRLVDQQKGGQLVDLRPGAVSVVSRSKDVLYGTLVVLLPTGEVLVRLHQPEDALDDVLHTLQVLSGNVSGETPRSAADILNMNYPERLTASPIESKVGELEA